MHSPEDSGRRLLARPVGCRDLVLPTSFLPRLRLTSCGFPPDDTVQPPPNGVRSYRLWQGQLPTLPKLRQKSTLSFTERFSSTLSCTRNYAVREIARTSRWFSPTRGVCSSSNTTM